MTDDNRELQRHLEETYGSRLKEIEARSQEQAKEIISGHENAAHNEADKLLAAAARRASEKRQAIVSAERAERRRLEQRRAKESVEKVKRALMQQAKSLSNDDKEELLQELKATVEASLKEYGEEAKTTADGLTVTAETSTMRFTASIDERIEEAMPAIIASIRQRGE